MNKFLLSVAACSLLASSAFAQVATNSVTAPAPTENTTPVPVANSTEKSSTAAPISTTDVAAPTASVTNTTPVVGTATVEAIPANPVVPSVEPVTSMPSIDQSFFNSLVDSFNSKNVDGVMSSMSANDVTFVTSTGIVIKDKEAVKNHLIAMMTGESPVTLSLTVDGRLEPKPGVAFTTGSLTKTTGNADSTHTSLETHKETISALVSYENNEWKIVALQSTKVEEPKPLEPVQEEKSQSSGLRTLLALVLGAAAGFMGARFMAKKSAQA